MSIAASLLRGSAFRTAELLALLGTTFFVTPLLVHELGGRLYGFWTLVGTFVGYYGFLDIGLTAAASRYLSQALGKGDEAELDRVASTAYYLFAAGAVVVGAATAASALACPLFIGDAAEAALFQKLILLMGAAAAVGFPSKVYTGMLTAGVRHDAIAGLSIARIALCNGGIYLALKTGHGIAGVAAVTFATTVLHYAATGLAARALFPKVRIATVAFETSRVASMFDYGAKVFVCQIGDILRMRLDTVVIAAFLGAGLVTPYVVGVRLVEGFVQLVRSSVGMMLPVFSRYEGRGDYDAIRDALLKVTKLSAILTGFVGFSLIFYGRAFILRWMGPGFETSYWVAAILCVSMIVALPQSPGIQLLYGVSKHKEYAVLSLCEGLVNLALSVILLRPLGLYGVALGTLASAALFKLLVQPTLVCRAARLPVRTYLVEGIALPLAKTAGALALFFAAASRWVSADYGAIAACAAVQTALFAPVAYFFIMDAPGRRAVSSALRSLAPKREPRSCPAA